MPYVDMAAPLDAVPGEPSTAHHTAFYLELTDTLTPGWFRTGRYAEGGHPTEAEAWQEWAARDDRAKYTGRRVIQVDWTCTVTVRPDPD